MFSVQIPFTNCLLFLQISSSDGNSASGKTPHFAWLEFQKKERTRIKILHRNRLSPKMDALEVRTGTQVHVNGCMSCLLYLLFFIPFKLHPAFWIQKPDYSEAASPTSGRYT